ncbi:MAG: low molecular weight protein-tyrosine-phosphatase [Candidatus Nitrospinota bacterium M3_3B_026]
MTEPRRTLFVCTGNLCRSPMAEYLTQAELAALGAPDVLVESAGTLGLEGAPAARPAVALLRKLGIDMSGHRARELTPEMLAEADLVVVMEKGHMADVLAMAPSARDKVVLMGTLAGDGAGEEIPDPLGHDEEFFQKTFETIHKAARRLAERLSEEGGADK